jgi:hypothetical protein
MGCSQRFCLGRWLVSVQDSELVKGSGLLRLAAARYCSSGVGSVLRFVCGPVTQLFHRETSIAIIGLCVMGVVQYGSRESARCDALKDNVSLWQMWSRNFLWISISYFARPAPDSLLAV